MVVDYLQDADSGDASLIEASRCPLRQWVMVWLEDEARRAS
jgi:hypothetical protein